MLYYTQPIETTNGVFPVHSGSLAYYEFELQPAETLTFELHIHIADANNLPQDHSFRAWVSQKKGGNSLNLNTVFADTKLTTLAKKTIVVYDKDAVQFDGEGVIPFPAKVGKLFLNVLNLSNEENYVSIKVS